MKKPRVTLYSILIFLLSTGLLHGGEVQIRILHINDFHGFAEPYRPLGSKETVGGIAYLAVKVDELRKQKPSLLLSAGDMIQGNNWASLFKGKSVIELMNEMREDLC